MIVITFYKHRSYSINYDDYDDDEESLERW